MPCYRLYSLLPALLLTSFLVQDPAYFENTAFLYCHLLFLYCCKITAGSFKTQIRSKSGKSKPLLIIYVSVQEVEIKVSQQPGGAIGLESCRKRGLQVSRQSYGGSSVLENCSWFLLPFSIMPRVVQGRDYTTQYDCLAAGLLAHALHLEWHVREYAASKHLLFALGSFHIIARADDCLNSLWTTEIHEGLQNHETGCKWLPIFGQNNTLTNLQVLSGSSFSQGPLT